MKIKQVEHSGKRRWLAETALKQAQALSETLRLLEELPRQSYPYSHYRHEMKDLAAELANEVE